MGLWSRHKAVMELQEQPVLFSHPCCSLSTIKEAILSSRTAVSSQGQINLSNFLLIGNSPRGQSCHLFCLPFSPAALCSRKQQQCTNPPSTGHLFTPWNEHLENCINTTTSWLWHLKPCYSALFREVLLVLYLSTTIFFFF